MQWKRVEVGPAGIINDVLSSTAPSPNGRVRQPILYADQMWRQQRFFAGFLVAVGLVMTSLLVYQGQLLQHSNLIWTMYVPSGLLRRASSAQQQSA